MQLGSVLRGFRKERELTQQNAGAKAGLPQNAISTIETQTRRVGVARLFKVISALDLELVLRARRKPAHDLEW